MDTPCSANAVGAVSLWLVADFRGCGGGDLVGSPQVQDAARGTGMTERQKLWQVELPMALPAILGGIRLSAAISMGTATIGSTVAASTLGETIIAGLINSNLAFVAQGALVVGALAIILNDLFLALERHFSRHSRAQKA